ncbi:MAG: hypothetical protein M1820_005534 [Bogoriella megaspora]|nr:MAG: hypothetical protein M1820_005534 [Bogoriella megaspora]
MTLTKIPVTLVLLLASRISAIPSPFNAIDAMNTPPGQGPSFTHQTADKDFRKQGWSATFYKGTTCDVHASQQAGSADEGQASNVQCGKWDTSNSPTYQSATVLALSKCKVSLFGDFGCATPLENPKYAVISGDNSTCITNDGGLIGSYSAQCQ